MAVPPKKAKTSSSSARHAAEHPPLWVMLKAAITNLKDRKGSSRQAIIKYILSNYKVQSTGKFKSAMKRCISKAVSEGKLVKTKGSFKLSSDEKTKKHKSGSVKKAPVKAKKSSGGGLSHKKPSKPKALKKLKPSKAKAAGGGGATTNSSTGGAGAGAGAGAAAAKKMKKSTATKVKKSPKPKTAPKK